MVTPEHEDVVDREEPAWHLGRTSILASLVLAFGLWVFQLVFNYGLASYACYPVRFPRTTVLGGFGWVWPFIVALNLTALVLALFAAALSFNYWRRTGTYDPRSFNDVLEKGEEGPKYLEVWGIVTGLGFAAVIVFNTFGLFLVPICLGIR